MCLLPAHALLFLLYTGHEPVYREGPVVLAHAIQGGRRGEGPAFHRRGAGQLAAAQDEGTLRSTVVLACFCVQQQWWSLYSAGCPLDVGSTRGIAWHRWDQPVWQCAE